MTAISFAPDDLLVSSKTSDASGLSEASGSSLISNALENVRDHLQALALSPNSFDRLDSIFEVSDINAVETQLADWANGLFSDMPEFAILNDVTMGGAWGAYSSENDTIYLSQALLDQNDITGLTQIILEEYGHALDERFSPNLETPGDEGELFGLSVLGYPLNSAELDRLRSDDDWGVLNVNGTDVLVEFNHTLSTATNIGVLSGRRVVRDFVGRADPNDYYRFTLNEARNFRLVLNGLSADADVHLLNNFGSVIQRSTAGGANPEFINRRLGAGTYFVRVYPFGGANTNYTLTLESDGAGNSFAAARNLGVLTGRRGFNDFVGGTDGNDYYRFTLNESRRFTLGMNGLSADADVQLLNSAGGIIERSTAGGTNTEFINRQLGAGTYYVRVYPFGGANTNYTLFMESDGAGNSLATARNVGFLFGSRSFRDFNGGTDPNDFYRFNLSNTSNVSILLNGLSADADLQLLDARGATVAASTNGGRNADGINRLLGPGTYYVRVYPFGGANANYALTLSAAPLFFF